MTPSKADWFTPAARAISPERLHRYTRFVGGMKVLLPSLAGGIVLALMLWPSNYGPPASPRKLTAADSTMEAPVYTGRDEEGKPFRVQGDVARQDPAAAGVTDVANPRGNIVLEDGSIIEGDARTAKFDQKKGLLDLDGQLTLHHSSGAIFQTEKATVDMNAKSASGNAPVKVTGSFGEVNAQGFQLVDQGKVVIFTGPSHARLKLGQGEDGSTALPNILPPPAASSNPGM